MTESNRQTIYLKDYKPPAYKIKHVDLLFRIKPEETWVTTTLECEKNPDSQDKDLTLIGTDLELTEIELDGKTLSQNEYELSEKNLILRNAPEKFKLKTKVKIHPHKNLSLEGLYKTGDIFCTQNESQGFRKITFYPDRPDVLATFTTRIEADKGQFPILLSNGNLVDSGDLEENRHFVIWEDPFPKPCYLFALVAGDLAKLSDSFTTMSGRKVALEFYVDKGNEDQCDHAMVSLKNAMKWDEDTFGLECDLDNYKVVAVDAFNFGAMENKGLNIFNSQCALAKPETATDMNYQFIEGVIGHEYFHNWTGNRVTCRDWFQITLKEGLTVFRDQEFSSDMGSRSVNRISHVRRIRDVQFVEDAGPNAHPIRPESYIEVSNFYTPTVYEKGSEVIRMIDTLIGRETFCKGITKYFELFDGQAVTTEDFLHAMASVSGRDFSQFKNWYGQKGTPICHVTSEYDEASKEYRLTVEQSAPKNADSSDYKPYYFPLSVGLLDEQGNDLVGTRVLEVSQLKEVFKFENVAVKPIPSLGRNFSAPVKLNYPYTQEELIFLFSNDTDAVNRYDAGQRLADQTLLAMIEVAEAKGNLEVSADVIEAYRKTLINSDLDPAFRAEALMMPSVASLTANMDICLFDSAKTARDFLIKRLAEDLEADLKAVYEQMQIPGDYSPDGDSIAKRSLKNVCLSYLTKLGKDEDLERAVGQFQTANNMTDSIAALSALCETESSQKEEALKAFYDKWKGNMLVTNKWLAVQAMSRYATPEVLKELEQNPDFDIKNPNKVRSLIGVFASNLVQFHDSSGNGYNYLADKIIEIDKFNPSTASGLAKAFSKYAYLDEARKPLMHQALERILKEEKLSPNCFEIISNTIGREKVTS